MNSPLGSMVRRREVRSLVLIKIKTHVESRLSIKQTGSERDSEMNDAVAGLYALRLHRTLLINLATFATLNSVRLLVSLHSSLSRSLFGRSCTYCII